MMKCFCVSPFGVFLGVIGVIAVAVTALPLHGSHWDKPDLGQFSFCNLSSCRVDASAQVELCGYPSLGWEDNNKNVNAVVPSKRLVPSASSDVSKTLSMTRPRTRESICLEFPFLCFLQPVVFELCSWPYDRCEAALRKKNVTSQSAWIRARDGCARQVCSCLSGTVSYRPQFWCEYKPPPPCQLYEICVPTGEACLKDFVARSLPSECTPFVDCALSSKEATSAQYRSCMSQRRILAPECNHTDACQWIPRQPPPHTNEPKPLPIALWGVLVATLLLIGVAAIIFYVKWRNAVIHDHGEFINIEEAEDEESSVPMFTVSDASDHTCSRCHDGGSCPYVLVPCGHRWCGCACSGTQALQGESAPLLGTAQGGPALSTSVNVTFPETCGACQKAVLFVVNLEDVFVFDAETSPLSVHRSNSESAFKSAGNTPTPRSPPNSHICAVCCESKVACVFLPCRHLAACRRCAVRLLDSRSLVAHHQDQSAKCHVCRALLSAAVVLTPSMISECFAYKKVILPPPASGKAL